MFFSLLLLQNFFPKARKSFIPSVTSQLLYSCVSARSESQSSVSAGCLSGETIIFISVSFKISNGTVVVVGGMAHAARLGHCVEMNSFQCHSGVMGSL